jgi:hypothetical protein
MAKAVPVAGTRARRWVSLEECEETGGHCWEGLGIELTSWPPQHPEACIHCGATRIGRPREAMEYSEVRPPAAAEPEEPRG